MASKQKKFEDLKVAQKFRYKRKLYVKDTIGATCLSDGRFPTEKELPDDALVTLVKVKIIVIG